MPRRRQAQQCSKYPQYLLYQFLVSLFPVFHVPRVLTIIVELPKFMAIAFSVALVLWLFISTWAWDSLVREQYTNHREEWVLCDRPSGVFYRPTGTPHWGGSMKMKLLGFRWALSPPHWSRVSPRARLAILVGRVSLVLPLVWIGFLVYLAR